MLDLAADNTQKLRRRANYFCFETSRRGRGEVAKFIKDAQKFGDVAIIGGMLRDLCLVGNKRFVSDVDLVAHPQNLRDFDRWINEIGAQKNRFGGFGVVLEKWKVDIWPIQRTWAAKEGHCEVSNFNDLLKATFFNWDAVLFSLSERKLIANSNYFENLKNRILDINLRPNPNPLGNSVRALRYAYIWQASFKPQLAEFVLQTIKDYSWQHFLEVDQKSFSKSCLSHVNPDDIIMRLHDLTDNLSSAPACPIDRPEMQYTLPL